jgi:8-oxo-dGTP pyrophosphatase MutT (NUDIX family)
LFEVRSDTLKHQPGEVSFPGGKMEGSETPEACAVRETCEELGLAAADVEVLGELNYIIVYSGFTMYAFLGLLDARALAAAVPSVEEVKEIFFVPLSFFLAEGPALYESAIVPQVAADFPTEKVSPDGRYNWRRGKHVVPIYTYVDPEANRERVIWGLTARLMNDFAKMLTEK